MLGHRTRVPVVNRPKVEQVTDHLPTSPAGHQDRAPNDRHQFRKLKAFAGGCRRLSQVTLLGGPRFHTFAVLFHRLNDFRNAELPARVAAVRLLDRVRSSEAYLAIDR
jgi:hypothetical protein